jgi:hypothetical protein
VGVSSIGSETLFRQRSIEDQAHEYSSESAGDGDGSDPCEEEEADSLEVDCLQGAVAEADTDGSANDAHRGRDGKRELREDEDGNGGAHLHRATWKKKKKARLADAVLSRRVKVREGDKPLLGEWYVILLPMTVEESS